jgi:transposase
VQPANLAHARQQYLAARAAGQSWQEAVVTAGLPVKRAAAYALEARFRLHGAAALPAGRHGHPYKLAGPARLALETLCRAHPDWPSAHVQQELVAQFGRPISVSQISRVRARLGLRYQPPKKRSSRAPTGG